MSVYKAIVAVQSALAQQGIAKARINTQGATFKFRGIDDVYAALAPLLSEHGLCMLPRVLSRSCDERTSKAGNALFYVTVDVEYDLVAAEDGSKHTIRVVGEAMDSGDKGSNKALSAAYKYAAFQAFCIPVEGEDDADATTPAPKPRPAPDPLPAPAPAAKAPAKADPDAVAAPREDRGPTPAITNPTYLPQGEIPLPTESLPQQDGEERGVVEGASSKDGVAKGTGKPYTRYSVKIDGTFYNTFDTTDGENAKEWVGQEVFYAKKFKKSDNPKFQDSWDLASIRRVDDSCVTYEEQGEPGFLFGANVPG